MRPGEAGEIVVRCEGRMRGFCLDANGCLCMLDRVDGMVIPVGVNIRAGERHHHPSVVEVAGFGIADERCGE